MLLNRKRPFGPNCDNGSNGPRLCENAFAGWVSPIFPHSTSLLAPRDHRVRGAMITDESAIESDNRQCVALGGPEARRSAAYAAITSISGTTPMIRITRFRL